MKAYERLIKYARVSTASLDDVEASPTSERQFDLARILASELKGLGIADAQVSDSCYVYGHLPATPGHESAPCLGFIAHMDTSPDFSGENVSLRLIENYDGGDVELGHGRALEVKTFPHLPSLAGRTLIVTGGDTLLGADDKAGIAEIMTLLEELIASGEPHGRVAVCFTPDEEVGRGTAAFDIPLFGADFAYTVDGGPEGEIVYENFNACSAYIAFRGFNVHPGSAKGVMINAALVAGEFNSLLPAMETPRHTSGYEGFYHLTGLAGACEWAEARYIIRDHDPAKFEMRKETLLHAAACLNEKYGEGTVTVTLREQYRNMAEKIKPQHYHLVENAVKAIETAGVKPIIEPIRGGTDGALLSWQGLPCPNLGTGGYAFHGPYEHITVEGMDKCVEILRNITRLYADGIPQSEA